MTDTVEQFNKRLDALVLQFENDFKERVKSKTPVDTGALQAAWAWDRSEPLHVFVNFMEYASYVELGTEHHAPVAMLGTTVLEAPQILKDAAKKVGF